MFVPLTAMDFLERAATAYRRKVGVIDEPGQPAAGQGALTYGRVAELAARQAARLDELGVAPGERVAIVSHNSSRLFTSFFGVSGWGRVLVPINFRLRPDEVQYIIDHSGARVLYLDPELAESLATVSCEYKFVLGSDDELYGSADRQPAPWEADENALATINYTSGTTARPKGVELTHRNLWINAVTFGLHTTVSDRDVYLHTLPLFHVNGWGMPYALTGVGGTHILLRKVDGAEILRRVRDHGVTIMCAAPAVAAAVLDAAQAWEGEIPGRGHVRVIMAGAPPPTETVVRVQEELGWEFIQIYGLTEASPLLTINRARPEWDGLDAAEKAAKLLRAGTPALGVRLEISEVEEGSGEIQARSNGIMRGYWRQPEETERALGDGWLHTGDGGELGDDGYLAIADRKKDVIITGGENVASIEVEDCLFSHSAVAEVAVIGVPSDKWGETVKALVVPKPGIAPTDALSAELIAWCKQRLAGYKSPTSVEFRDRLPRTATGKLQKFKLRQPYWEGQVRQVN
ncbi:MULTISPECIES: AMP-binding protein [Mycolicibacterium]|uniref:Long-chain-fatty-acid--CoA ligase FadD13 n=1 Tax=Mycolicibacterium senegalense TaxID=1796 RepID=A0A378W7E7_9MYCO|nr:MULTISPECIES: AMP-binding protein [Mycolicibacterium]MCV7336064.1 AMP-binding protein [Mycolicibacterium senegalense]MDR7287930.1 acyl-CoA synthetase (AMP-forming)/AMP-acid ligase II [Mycolicibacterium senegalense]QZA24933.1 AMP-binding protein [Mycolicibacterium senegalense]CDP86649.1 putative medium-chain acyl-CoA ligase [Mycolicibacterium farcinogenes]SUA28494.1 2-succinylbenzoate--CoA ligase [Mycolicibacterium senegalense]